jgi:hypothetical protein
MVGTYLKSAVASAIRVFEIILTLTGVLHNYCHECFRLVWCPVSGSVGSDQCPVVTSVGSGCVCGIVADAYGAHALSCNVISSHYGRHRADS